MFNFFLVFILLTSCQPQEPTPPTVSTWQNINSRDEGIAAQRFPLYRAKVPNTWTRFDPPTHESILDSTKALCEFWIEKKVKIAVHNFPTDKLEQRVPSQSQIHRWKQQFDSLNPGSVTTIPQAHGGYSGLFFEGTGILQGQPATVIGWSMLIAPEHYQQLHGPDPYKAKQMRADYTIKIVGEPEAIVKHKEEILAFGKSFELIEEIPAR